MFLNFFSVFSKFPDIRLNATRIWDASQMLLRGVMCPIAQTGPCQKTRAKSTLDFTSTQGRTSERQSLTAI